MSNGNAGAIPGVSFDPRTGAKKNKTFAVRLGKKLRAPVNRYFMRRSLVPHQEILDKADLPWIADLESAYPQIRSELLKLLDTSEIPALRDLSPDHGRIAPTRNWKTFFFYAYGYRAIANRRSCPATAAALDKVPGLVVSFYSILEPGMHITPHRGLTKALLNVHLPLLVPSGKARCQIRIGDKIACWNEGKALLFDDTYEHEVWNDTDEIRAVLLLQVRRPVTWSARLLASFFLTIAKRTSYIQEARRALTKLDPDMR